MKIVAKESFFESIRECFGFKYTLRCIRTWILEHFTKDFWNIIKTALKGYPWDYCFLLYLEKSKIIEMANYIEKHGRYEGYEKDVKYMKIAVKLIDIMTETNVDLFHYDGKIEFEDTGNGLYELKQSDDFKYVSHVKVNTKNVSRFTKDPDVQKWYKDHVHELYVVKARHLYHKIRLEQEQNWWD